MYTNRFQGAPRRARSKDASYVTQHPRRPLKTSSWRTIVAFFGASMAQVLGFVAEQAMSER
jgi:hypothetical protein